ncbi:MAG: hypothetical protein WCH76_04050 [Candidatus Riflemargulisbacteria bacterium]
MKNKVIALDKSLTKILDHLEERENLLTLYLQLSKGNTPKNLAITGFFINPLTIFPNYAKSVARRLQQSLRDAYVQDPLTYIRLSTNIPILQRTMLLEHATSLEIINNPALKQKIYSALRSKLISQNYDGEKFLKGLSNILALDLQDLKNL